MQNDEGETDLTYRPDGYTPTFSCSWTKSTARVTFIKAYVELQQSGFHIHLVSVCICLALMM